MNEKSLGQIGIIGNGSWGTALTKILTDNGRQVHWWVRNQEAINHLNNRLHNPHYLTSVRFSAGDILPTNDLSAMLEKCDTVIVAVPSAYAQKVIEQVDKSVWVNKNIISAIKGILPPISIRRPTWEIRNSLRDTKIMKSHLRIWPKWIFTNCSRPAGRSSLRTNRSARRDSWRAIVPWQPISSYVRSAGRESVPIMKCRLVPRMSR